MASLDGEPGRSTPAERTITTHVAASRSSVHCIRQAADSPSAPPVASRSAVAMLSPTAP